MSDEPAEHGPPHPLDVEARAIIARERFLDLRLSHVGPLNAAIEVGWTPAQLRREMADPDFAEMVSMVDERRIERVEQVAFVLAEKGNMRALELVLFNRAPSRWRDVKRVEIVRDERVSIEVVTSVKQATLELLQEQGVAALQRGSVGVIEAESRVVDSD